MSGGDYVRSILQVQGPGAFCKIHELPREHRERPCEIGIEVAQESSFIRSEKDARESEIPISSENRASCKGDRIQTTGEPFDSCWSGTTSATCAPVGIRNEKQDDTQPGIVSNSIGCSESQGDIEGKEKRSGTKNKRRQGDAQAVYFADVDARGIAGSRDTIGAVGVND